MTLQLETRERRDVTIVDAVGRLTLGTATSSLRELIAELAANGSRRILVNMAGLAQVDSSGMGELIAAYTTIVESGGEMKLLNLTRRVNDLMEITKLCTVFETFDDEDAAVDSYSESSKTELQARWDAFFESLKKRDAAA